MRMIKLITLLLLVSSYAEAYTFNNNFEAAFKSNKVTVTIDELTTCANAGMTVYELRDLIEPAINKFWNRIPTTNLRLKDGGFSEPLTNVNTGRLCAPTDEACITAAGGTVIAPAHEIVIACNNQALNFGGANVLAVTIPNNFSGKSIAGAIILINESSTIFTTLDKAGKIAVLAHEIGHAIGLGHTDSTSALMYYKTVTKRKALGEDDMRGVSYLYPMQIDAFGLLGGCATIQNKDGTPGAPLPFWQMGGALGLMILLSELYRLLKRSNTRSAT